MFFQHHTQLRFTKWIRQNLECRFLLILSCVAILIQIIGFKNLYPFPNLLPDSYSYLEAAFYNQSINMWPIGYSKFLRVFSCLTNSHMALVIFQYLLLQFSVLYFLFTIAYLFKPGKWTLRILFFCSIMNPLLLHVSNFVSSDALFATLSLVWFTQLMWIIYKPDRYLLVTHALVLLLAFTVRYNAMYYPFISILITMLVRTRIQTKFVGVAAIITLTGGFMGRTLYQYHAATGTTQFSAFGGWQLASNALFAYAHVQADKQNTVPVKFRVLHTLVNRHMDSLNHAKQRQDIDLGVYYLWDEQAPLKKNMHYIYREDSITDGFNRWATMGPLYGQYGRYLIEQHPAAFIQYYLWPNILNYYSPPAEFLGTYNMGKDSIEAAAIIWFNLKSNKVYSLSKDKIITTATFLPVSVAVTNLGFLVSFISFIILGGLKKVSTLFKMELWLVLFVWLCNTGFSVLASPIVLRYQVFPTIITFAFLVLLVIFIIQESKSVDVNARNQQGDSLDASISVQLS